jgi:hypothetical protein
MRVTSSFLGELSGSQVAAEAVAGEWRLVVATWGEAKALFRSFRKTSQCSAVPHYKLDIALNGSFRPSQNRIQKKLLLFAAGYYKHSEHGTEGQSGCRNLQDAIKIVR